MPPRISQSILQPISQIYTKTNSIAAFLVPFLHFQSRNASILSSLSDLPGASQKKIRRGRGASSGKGKTSGRGQNGQKARGKVPKGFQGGQTPESVTHGKFGFTNVHAVDLTPINLDTIQEWIRQGRLDPTKPITLKELLTSRALHGIKDGVKLLARNSTNLTTPINIVVSRASQSAIAAVEALGGTVTTRFYTSQAITKIKRNLMHPYMSLRWDPKALGVAALELPNDEGITPEERVTGLGYEYRLPDPTSRKAMEYYRNARNRGYLAHTVKEGETASLFYKPPKSAAEIAMLKRSSKSNTDAKRREENKLW